jgi:multiple sugar transport system substrate-binding protein
MGKAFVEAANAPGGKRDHFYCPAPDVGMLRNSMGVGMFDETQTHCTLDVPKYAEALRLVQRWREMHIIPSKADEASFVNGSGGGYGGTDGYLFNTGCYAIQWSGRHLVIQYRLDNIGRVARGEPPLELAVVEPPNGGFPMTDIATRAAGVYAASKHLEAAERFQAFLASDSYNLQVVRDGDAMPPDPKWAGREEYLHPAEDPARGIYKQTEWNFHGPFAQGALDIAIGPSYSPFVIDAVAQREDGGARDIFLESNQLTAEQAAHRAAVRIDEEIQRTLLENPSLQPQYDALCKQQKQIDELKAAGKKVPLNLILDPFRRAYMTAHHQTE